MSSPIDIDPALVSLHARFDGVAREVSLAMSTLSSRIQVLPEYARSRLASTLLDFQSVQLRLRRFVDEVPGSPEAQAEMLEWGIAQELELLDRLTALAEGHGLIRPSVQPMLEPMLEYEHIPEADQGSADDHGAPDHTGHQQRAMVIPHQHMISYAGPPGGHYQPQMPAQATSNGHPHWGAHAQPYHDAIPPGYPPAYYGMPQYPAVYYMAPPPWAYEHAGRNAPAAFSRAETEVSEVKATDEDDEPRFRHSLRNFGGLAMMGLAVIIGGMAFADRNYLSGSNRTVAMDPPQDEPTTGTRQIIRFEERIPTEADEMSRAGQTRAKDLPRTATAVPLPVNATQSAASSKTGALQTDGRGWRAGASIEQSIEAPQSEVISPPRASPKTPGPALAREAAVRPAPLPPPPPPPVQIASPVKLAPSALPPATKPAVASPRPPPTRAIPEPEPDDTGLFVPVLSTHKDPAAAREAFLELQKQHAAVLGAQQSEIQASGGANGTWHRLVVTPATSKSAATEVCAKLRAAGYARCWIKAY